MSKRDEFDYAYVKELLSTVGMEEPAIVTLLAKPPAQRTREIIVLFASRQDEMEKSDILRILFHIGDVKRTGDFYTDIIEGDNDWLKCSAALQAWKSDKYQKHDRLVQVLEAYLQGLNPIEAWLRRQFPDGVPNGYVCPLRGSSANTEDKKGNKKEEE